MTSPLAAWLLDDGELDRVQRVLERMGVHHERIVGRNARAPSHARLWVTSARRGLALERDTAKVPWLCVHGGELAGICDPLRALGVHYVAHQNLDELTLELLISQLLYRGQERRRSPRLPLGTEVVYRTPRRYAKAVVSDVSSGGASMICDEPLELGCRVALTFPGRLLGENARNYCGEVIQVSRDENEVGWSVLVRFLGMEPQARVRLESLLRGDHVGGPVAPLVDLPDDTISWRRGLPFGRTDTDSTLDSEGPLTLGEVVERRRARRGLFIQSLPSVWRASANRPFPVLGRDLSRSGLRIAPQPDLAIGMRAALAIWDANGEPLVVDARVARDDGAEGLALVFEGLEERLALALDGLIATLPPVSCVKLRE